MLAFVVALVAGCSSLPATSPSDITLYDEDITLLTTELAPMVESPPIEPVEPPLLAPPLLPPPEAGSAPPTTASAQQPPSATTPAPPANVAPAGNVFAAAAPTTLAPVPVVPPEDLAALTLIADLQRYNGLGPDEVKRELGAASNALSRERTDVNRVRLAVLYTLVRASPQDDQRALQLLDNVAKSGGGPTPVKAIAAILHVQVSDRVRTVREEQMKANDAVQKLEALRPMERSLLRGGVGGGGGVRGGRSGFRGVGSGVFSLVGGGGLAGGQGQSGGRSGDQSGDAHRFLPSEGKSETMNLAEEVITAS